MPLQENIVDYNISAKEFYETPGKFPQDFTNLSEYEMHMYLNSKHLSKEELNELQHEINHTYKKKTSEEDKTKIGEKNKQRTFGRKVSNGKKTQSKLF